MGDFFMYLIKDMPINERPRERLLQYGAKSLSTYELIAIILRVGYGKLSAIDLAKQIVKEVNDIQELRSKTINELSEIKGIGETKAITLLAAIELGERVLKPTKENLVIQSPNDVFELLKYDLMDLKQEVLVVLYLDVKTSLIAKKKIFMGNLKQSFIHPREVFKYAVKYSAYSIILVHNHPSGDVYPSIQDIEATKRFEKAGQLLQIEVIDHIIIAKDNFISIKEYVEISNKK